MHFSFHVFFALFGVLLPVLFFLGNLLLQEHNLLDLFERNLFALLIVELTRVAVFVPQLLRSTVEDFEYAMGDFDVDAAVAY